MCVCVCVWRESKNSAGLMKRGLRAREREKESGGSKCVEGGMKNKWLLCATPESAASIT